jgi:hypothetical protein
MRNLPSLLLFLGISSVCAVGCGGATTSGPGGGGGPPATVNGQVGGQPVPNTDTVGIVTSQNIPGPNGMLSPAIIAEVAVLNIPNTCAILQRHGEPASTKLFAVGVFAPGSSIAAGTYKIETSTSALPSQTHAQAQYATTDAKCVSGPTVEATSGTVTITSTATTSSSTLQGSFDVTMSTGDHLTGTFDAPVCHFDSTTTTTPACGS